MFVTKFENKTYGIQHNLRDLFSVEKVKSEYKSSSKNIYKGKNKHPDPWSLSFSSVIKKKKKQNDKRPRIIIHLIQKFLLPSFEWTSLSISVNE